MTKYALMREGVAAMPGVRLREAPRASDGELALVHAPAYVAALQEGHVDPAILRDIGFPWSVAMVERSRRSAGATIAAARTALTVSTGSRMRLSKDPPNSSSRVLVSADVNSLRRYPSEPMISTPS